MIRNQGLRDRAGTTNGVWWLGLSLVLAGCVVESELPRTVPFPRMGVELERAVCEQAYAKCGCELQSSYSSEESCDSAVRGQIRAVRTVLDGPDAEGLTYDGECVAAWVDEMSALGCRSRLEPSSECQRPCQWVHGPLELGEPCRYGVGFINDCVKGLLCIGSVCSDPCDGDANGFYAGEGDSCTERSCADRFLCSFIDEQWICAPKPQVGESCLFGGCEAGSFCEAENLNDPMSDMRCFEPRELGEPCRGPLQCDSVHCPNGFCAVAPNEGEACVGSCEEGFACVADVCVPADPLLCTVELPLFF